MAKRKPVDVITVDAASREVKVMTPPPCYNSKCRYCREAVCGEWFVTCKDIEGQRPPAKARRLVTDLSEVSG